MDLPAELRLRIYSAYFDYSIIEKLQIATLPPVCEVSRLVRSESALLFYGSREFWLPVGAALSLRHGRLGQPRMPRFERFLDHAPLHFI
jgi:hypothetical protein